MKACVSDSFAGARVAMPIGAPRPIGAMNRSPNFRPATTAGLPSSRRRAANPTGTFFIGKMKPLAARQPLIDRRDSGSSPADSFAVGILTGFHESTGPPVTSRRRRHRSCDRAKVIMGAWRGSPPRAEGAEDAQSIGDLPASGNPRDESAERSAAVDEGGSRGNNRGRMEREEGGTTFLATRDRLGRSPRERRRRTCLPGGATADQNSQRSEEWGPVAFAPVRFRQPSPGS